MCLVLIVSVTFSCHTLIFTFVCWSSLKIIWFVNSNKWWQYQHEKYKLTRHGTNTREDTCNIPIGYEWRYQMFSFCVSTLYMYLSERHFINSKSKHKERVFLRLLNFQKVMIILIWQVQYPPLWWCWQTHFHRISDSQPLSKEYVLLLILRRRL